MMRLSVRDRTLSAATGLTVLLLGIALIVVVWVIPSATLLPPVETAAGRTLLKQYNTVVHIIFFVLLVAASLSLLWQANQQAKKDKNDQQEANLPSKFVQQFKTYPLACSLFSFYTVLMLQQASWFYKEIIGWYKDIFANHLLDNFSLRWSFIKETMFRYDFRFFPLSHQDLHLLSWLTPYVKIWMLVNAVELFTIVILGAKIADALSSSNQRRETRLIFGLLFLFLPATGFTFFQFIYSERLVVLLFAFYAFYYVRYWQEHRKSDRYSIYLCGLLGLFFKDTGFILFVVPATTVIFAGSVGLLTERPKLSLQKFDQWIKAYQLEIAICSLTVILVITFLYLSYIPSLYHGNTAYDSELRFVRFEPDARILILMVVSAVRYICIIFKRVSFSLLDAFNTAALAYALALYGLVGFRAGNYMALPVQFIATIDLVVLWNWATTSWRGRNQQAAKHVALSGCFASLALIGSEHLARVDFHHRISEMQVSQESWRSTYDKIDRISKLAKQNGDEVNLIYSKSWFRNRDHLRRLKYDRLIYLDPDTHAHIIFDGIDAGQNYIPKPGDFLLNIDTGKQLEKHSIDLSSYQLIYEYDPDLSNGKIYRRFK